jgi:methionyl-tRNA formyltransferase
VRPQSGSRVDTVRAVQEQRLRIALFGQDGMPFTEFAAETAADIGEVVRFADGDPVEWLRSVEPDLLLSAGYGKLLPAEALQVPRIGAINVHPSLLPEYKGSYPVFWAFFDGRDELGITVHEMTPEFDSGAILAQDTLPIDPRDDPEAAYRGVITLGRQTLGRALQEIADTEIISGSPQLEEGCFRGVPWRELDRLQFDWALPASEIVRRQRIFTEYMHIVVRGERVFPRRVELVSARRGSPPGKVIGRGIDSVTVRAGDGGAVKLSGLRVRKDPRGETDRARSLLLGLRVPRHL